MTSDGALEVLYPFLYADSRDLDGVVAGVRQSTIDKAREVVALRDEVCRRHGEQLAACAEVVARSLGAGGTLLAFGNGGSSTDAQALVTLFLDPPPGGRALPALCLTNDAAVLTALANDVGFEVVFARQIAAFGRAGDVAFGISTSGNSANVVAGLAEARRRGLVTVATAGYDGGRMAEPGAVDFLFVIPSTSVHRIQEAQTTVYDVLWELVQEQLAEQQPRVDPALDRPGGGHR